MREESVKRSVAARKGWEHRSERDEETRGELDPATLQLWKKVGAGIKGTPHQRAERFKEYVKENPREAFEALDDFADDAVARMVAAQERADRAEAARAEALDEAPARVYGRPMARKKKKKLFGAAAAAVARSKSKRKRKRKTTLTARPRRESVKPMAKRRRHRRSSSLARHHVGGSPSRARKAGRVIGGIASENKHMMGAVLGAAALGFAKKQGYTIPHIGTIGEAGTLALAGYLLDKFKIVQNRMLRHATTGFAAVAVYEMTSTGNYPGASTAATKTSGDDVDGAYDVR